MTSPGLRPAIPPISQQKLPLRHHVTWACVVSPPATAELSGTRQHVRSPLRAPSPQPARTVVNRAVKRAVKALGTPPIWRVAI